MKPKVPKVAAARIPALIPRLEADATLAIRCARFAVNDQILADTLQAEYIRAIKKTGASAHTRQLALLTAVKAIQKTATESLQTAISAGGLLLAFHSSKAFVPALPASQTGGAA